MWIADNWKDYELIDASNGERLERWGQHILVRPDPQVIWKTPRTSPVWKRPEGRYSRSHTGGGSWDKGGLPASWDIRYGSLTFHVKPMNFKHTGLFPEQAANWDWMQKKIREADRPISVLNLFAYTGGASVTCLAAGASVCHVDAAKGMVAWAKDNAAASGVADANVRWIVDDCAKFVEREIRRGRRYDAIIMDPPSYGRGPGGEVWKLETNLWPFVELVSGVLSDDPLFVIINSYTTGLSPSVLTYLSERNTMEPILRTEHLTFTYPGEEHPSLGDLSLEIARGSFVAILGHNGSGKSTLAKLFNAILLPTGGKVYVDGMDTADENNLLSVRATVGMVFQNPDNQIVANVVEDDVAFAPENLGVPPQEIRARVDAALRQVGMYDFRLHAPHLLSGGQKQRVAIAGVIAMQPKCIVLDEPTAMLDPSGRREVIDTATKLCREQGITVVLITHHMEECVGADRVIVLSNGAVVADGAPKQVFPQVGLLQKEGLTAPVTVRLLDALRAHGMDVPIDALTVSDCADAVAAALKK